MTVLTSGSPTLVIVNGGSGKKHSAEIVRRLREIARHDEDSCDFRVIRGAKQMLAATHEARTGAHRRVIAGGGDGTLNAVASSLVGTGKEFAALPLGTFNYFARDFGLSLDLETAFRYCLRGDARPISVGELNGIPFLNNGSIGIYPKVLEVREHTYRTFGRSRLAAYWSVLQALRRFHINLHAEITVANAPAMPIRTPFIFVGRNATQLDEFLLPGSDCVAHDQLAAYVLPPSDRMTLIKLAIRMATRTLQPYENVRLFCASELQVHLRSKKKRTWTAAIDGERRTVSSPLTFRIRPNALLAVLPNRIPGSSQSQS